MRRVFGVNEKHGQRVVTCIDGEKELRDRQKGSNPKVRR